MKGSELTIEYARKQLAEYIEHFIDDRGCTFEEATTRALEQMKNQDFYFVQGDAIDGG